MSRRKRQWLVVLVIVVGLCFIGRPVFQVCFALLIDDEAKPLCHKQVDGAFQNWQDEHKTREFPNIRGESWGSMAVLSEIDAFPELKSHYNYVPGLTRDDPGDLVLMYVNKPTRWTWHGEFPLRVVSVEKAWILVPVDLKFYGSRDVERNLPPGEFSERVSFGEFRQRLEKTLKYLEDNKRQNWEAVVKEHSDFLKSTAGANP